MTINLNIKNLKTTLSGVAALLISFSSTLGIHLNNDIKQELIALFVSIGLIFAKDAEKFVNEKIANTKKEE
jgi:hypothetical protein